MIKNCQIYLHRLSKHGIRKWLTKITRKVPFYLIFTTISKENEQKAMIGMILKLDNEEQIELFYTLMEITQLQVLSVRLTVLLYLKRG